MFSKETRWHFENRVHKYRVPENMLCWLLDSSSLTARIISACSGRFRVQVLSQHWTSPQQNEARRLAMRERQVALVREVYLYCDDTPWVFARTVIPRSTLTGREKYLANLGNKPLGAVLFADPFMHRDQFEVACIRPGEYLYQRATEAGRDVSPDAIWGRRSAFYLSNKPLLVNEIFLPAIARCPL